MGLQSYNTEINSPIPPAKIFKAFVLDVGNLVPKILPDIVKSVQILEGDGGAGTIKQITFGKASEFKSMKQKFEALDKQKFCFSYSIIEGDVLMGVLEKISFEGKVEAGPNGGSIYKSSSTYHTKGDAHITEELVNIGKEKIKGIFKAVEAYLWANPNAYN